MSKPNILLVISTVAFYCIGGAIDYWQSARQHNKPIPKFLKDYFALFWLILYSGILPFLMVYFASGFNSYIALKYLGGFFIGVSLWDFVYARLDKNKLVYNIKDYWFWGKKDYGLTKNQLIVWHVIRILVGFVLLMN